MTTTVVSREGISATLEPDGSDQLSLAGDRMTFREDDEGTAHITFDDKGTGRVCAECQLCCRLLPVQSLNKPANKRCTFSKANKGCSIYSRRPWDCKTWSCRWLADPLTHGMKRPDRVHYVIDLQYDTLRGLNEETGEFTTRMQMIQVWVDPAHPHAHRDPGLRAYLQMMAEKWGVCAVIRYGSGGASDNFLLIAPALTGDGKWLEKRDNMVIPRERYDQLEQALGE